ncbi:hypothetical protein BJ980_001867 [Nocardioides daedukensis]|uniref:Uncharacterized protein n=1 Tax=Nocardioides daedukensis TaxID=634462 RepID=A0A7Y9S3A9_9ACTN|nr:hypothetical protein [Nocardioides daedukensis]NYG58944.1 hypothetical protein [Nocardioides daedukensis]
MLPAQAVRRTPAGWLGAALLRRYVVRRGVGVPLRVVRASAERAFRRPHAG